MTVDVRMSQDKCPSCGSTMEFLIRRTPNLGRSKTGVEVLHRKVLRYCRTCKAYRRLTPDGGSPPPGPRIGDYTAA